MASLDHTEDDEVQYVFPQDGLYPTIADHTTHCIALFQRYMIVLGLVLEITVIDDQRARFTLWASDMDIYGPLNASLDYRLRFSPTIVESIHQLLGVICDTLTSSKHIDDPPQTPSRKTQCISEHDDSEVTADDNAILSDCDVDQAGENISKIADTIGRTVTQLYRLSSDIRKSATDIRAREITRYRDDEEANNAIAELSLSTECYIRSRFSKAPDMFRSALVGANALRLQRLYYQRSHRRRMGMRVQDQQTTPAVVQLPKIKESAPAVRSVSSVLQKTTTTTDPSGPAVLLPVPVMNATTEQMFAGALCARTTSEVYQSKPVLVNNKSSFPPLPTTHECPYCGIILEFKGTTMSMLWNNHVIEDLEPFICVFASCLEARQRGTSPLTFETLKAWISHMQNARGNTWECRAPSHDLITFDQEISFQEHCITEHSVPEMHVGALSNAARRPGIVKVEVCPFGDDIRPPEKVEPGGVFSSEALQSHVAARMEEIALLALKNLPGHVDELANDVDIDRPLGDDGAGFVNLSGSCGVSGRRSSRRR